MAKDVIKIKDIIHGEIIIDEPVVVELIKSKPFQRLRGIEQGGYAPLYNNPKKIEIDLLRNSRFEHSIGVYWLLKKYEDSLEAQISGLLHDISHMAFSHVIDYVLDGCQKTQNYQDNIHEEFIKNSIVPTILKKYGFDPERIIKESNFPLLENNIPDVCADRLDYLLRNVLIFRVASRDEIDGILEHLKAKDNEWHFDDEKYAQAYASLFKEINQHYFSNFRVAVMFFALSDFFRYALDKKYLDKKDFAQVDRYVLDKTFQYLDKDERLAGLYYNIEHPEVFRQVEAGKGRGPVYCKSRIVDPYILKNKRLVRLSALNKKWVKVVKEELKPKEYYLEIVK